MGIALRKNPENKAQVLDDLRDLEQVINLGKIDQLRFKPQLVIPTAGLTKGYLYYDINSNKLRYWNGTAWIDLIGAGSGPGPIGPIFTDYFYLPGRSGGQVGYGGTLGTDSLTLISNVADGTNAVQMVIDGSGKISMMQKGYTSIPFDLSMSGLNSATLLLTHTPLQVVNTGTSGPDDRSSVHFLIKSPATQSANTDILQIWKGTVNKIFRIHATGCVDIGAASTLTDTDVGSTKLYIDGTSYFTDILQVQGSGNWGFQIIPASSSVRLRAMPSGTGSVFIDNNTGSFNEISDLTIKAATTMRGVTTTLTPLNVWSNAPTVPLQTWRTGGSSPGNILAQITKDGYMETLRLLLDGSTSGTLTFIPAAATTSYSLTWPAASTDGYLKNTGGIISFDSTPLTSLPDHDHSASGQGGSTLNPKYFHQVIPSSPSGIPFLIGNSSNVAAGTYPTIGYAVAVEQIDGFTSSIKWGLGRTTGDIGLGVSATYNWLTNPAVVALGVLGDTSILRFYNAANGLYNIYGQASGAGIYNCIIPNPGGVGASTQYFVMSPSAPSFGALSYATTSGSDVKYDNLSIGANGTFLTSDGTAPGWRFITGTDLTGLDISVGTLVCGSFAIAITPADTTYTFSFVPPDDESDHFYNLPPASGTFVLAETNQDFSGLNSFKDVVKFYGDSSTHNSIECYNTSSVLKTFIDKDGVLWLAGSLKVPGYSTSVTDWLTNATSGTPGYFKLVNHAVDVVNDGGPVKLVNTVVAGLYKVVGYAVVRSVMNTSMTLTLGWTDNKQAQSTTFSLAAAAGSKLTIDYTLYAASGDITLTGTTPISGTYDLFVKVVPIV